MDRDKAIINKQFCCPKCKGELSRAASFDLDRVAADAAFGCNTCSTVYPIIGGIPDFRVYADPYIDIDADRKKGLLLAEKARKMSFADLVAFYYSITPEVPDDLARYYFNHHLAGTTRGAGLLRRFSAYGIPQPTKDSSLLDLGCGTAGFLTVASKSAGTVTGVDIAFRWLIVAKKRLEELGCDNVTLVCACADYLPFPDQQFDTIVAENLLEHMRDQTGLFAEIARTRASQSSFYARTVNRFALGPEPHVGLWGVGYLPRRLMNSYVKLFKGIPYEHIFLQSSCELRASIRSSGQEDLHVECAKLSPDDYQHQPPLRRRLFELFSKASAQPQLAPILSQIGPYLDVVSLPMASKKTVREFATSVS